MAAADPTSPPPIGEGNLIGGPGDSQAYRALLANGRFRHLFLAMLTSSLGDWIGFFAILALTESVLGGDREAAFGVAGVLVARVLPALLLGTVAGVLTDRWDRRKVMIWTDIGRGLVMFMLAFSTDLFQLFVLTLVIEMMSALFIPAKDATVPTIVKQDRLTTANQMSLVATYGTFPIGSLLFAALAGLGAWLGGDTILAERPAVLAIWLNAGTFFVSAYFITRVEVPRRSVRKSAAAKEGSALDEMKAGFTFIAGQPLVRALIGGIVAAMLAAGVVVGVGPFFADRVNAGGEGFGLLGTVVGLGLLGGIIAAGRLSRRLSEERIFAPGIGLAGVALIVTALMPRFDLAAIPAFLMGSGAGVAFVTGYTLLQKHSTDELRGRTFAAFNAGVRLALFAAVVIGPVVMGIIGLEPVGADGTFAYQIGGARITLMLAGAVAAVGAVWTGRSVHQVLSGKRGDPSLLAPRPARHGVFIAFEGGEGAGKTTQIERLAAAVRRAGFEVLVTREPGGTRIGEELRAMLLDPHHDVDPRAEALLYAAARAQHVREVITPALDRGTVVICDRFIDSSVVYQGVARGLGTDWIWSLSNWATDGVVPDRVILLDVDPEVGLARAGDADDHDRLESAGLEFHRAVNAAYRERAQMDPGRSTILDASLDPDQLAKQIRAMVLDLVEEHTSTMDAIPQAEPTGNGA